jgi:hypothetical protein
VCSAGSCLFAHARMSRFYFRSALSEYSLQADKLVPDAE